MEFLLVVLLVLTIVSLYQFRAIKRDVRTLGVTLDDVRERLKSLRRDGDVRPPAAPPPVVPSSPHPPEARIVPPAPPAPAAGPVPTAIPIPASRPPPVPAGPPPLPVPDLSPAPALRPPSMPAAREALRKIWQWILVGEEFRPSGVSMEYAVATTWLMRAGIVAVVMCVAYFLKWSVDNKLIGPMGRVGISLLAGAAMLGTGLRMLGRRWNLLGQGFMGGGLAVLYFSLYAAGPREHLLGIEAVFGLMSLVTVVAGLLSVRTNSLLVAVLGIIGGFGTPIMLSTGTANFPALFSYLLLLNLGILGVATFRSWRLLHYLGFLFTWAVYAAAMGEHYRQSRDFPVALAFLSLFFLIHSLVVFLHNLRLALRATVLEILHLVFNAGLYSVAGYWLIRNAAGRPYPALLTAALGVFYILHVGLFLRRRAVDRPLLLALISLSGLYTVLTLPLLMEKESLTIGWSLMAFLFFWLGTRLRNTFIRQLGYGLYLLVLGRLVLFDVPRDFGTMRPPVVPFAVYGKRLFSHLWTFGTVLVSWFAAFSVARRSQAAAGDEGSATVPAEAGGGIESPLARAFFFWSLIGVLFLYLQLECHALLGYAAIVRPSVLTLLWCGLAFFLLARILDGGRAPVWAALWLCLAVVVAKSLWDMTTWDLHEDGWFHAEYTLLNIGVRWMEYTGILLLFFLGAWLLGRRGDDNGHVAPRLFGYGGLALLFLYLTLETNTLLHCCLPEFRGGGVSVLWTAFALGMLIVGIWKQVTPLRYAGLVLFTIVIAKVFLLDLAHMPVIYRVLAFLVVGILLLLGSFAYLYAARQFRKEAP